jgi:hypothetical protein
MASRPKLITNHWLRRHQACEDGWQAIFADRWPEGAPVTLETALEAITAGISWADVMWVAVRCLPSRRKRREFIIFTLRQRQPHLVTLFRQVKLNAHAKAIEALDWSDLDKAVRVLAAAAAAAWAAWDAAGDAAGAAWAVGATCDAWDAARDAARATGAARDAAWRAARAARDTARDARDTARDARDTARDARDAWDAAYHEQLEWIANEIGASERRPCDG